MRRLLIGVMQVAAMLPVLGARFAVAQAKPTWAIAIHGGAGAIDMSKVPPETKALYQAGLDKALKVGAAVLERDGRPLDAVEAAIKVLEDDPLFNAGKGAVFNEHGVNEMDAAIMDGATLNAGAVAGVHATKNPISLARAVMERTHYVMLAGPGADEFSKTAGLQQEPPSYFWTAKRWRDLLKELKDAGKPLPLLPEGVTQALVGVGVSDPEPKHKYGTVGVVVRDRKGNLAAGTSTGGITAKMPGRIGDTPIIGAGTYASNASCAVSGTGVGEYFIRLNLARSICDLIEYKGMTAQAAADEVVQKRLPGLKGGEGGVIVMDRTDAPVWSFNTAGMFRARMVEGGAEEVVLQH